VIGRSPIYIFSGLGAIAAILLLVFKDSIWGFVASIQLSANNMIQVGDWVTVPNYGADGDVLEINLTTIKVQNFDLTITTIPTYAFISDSFTNWRGMSNSNGRRIKRAVSIKIDSIGFCDNEMLERFQKIELVSDYVVQRKEEIKAYNTV
jgi:miniconductance mechanosensitive channel